MRGREMRLSKAVARAAAASDRSRIGLCRSFGREHIPVRIIGPHAVEKFNSLRHHLRVSEPNRGERRSVGAPPPVRCFRSRTSLLVHPSRRASAGSATASSNLSSHCWLLAPFPRDRSTLETLLGRCAKPAARRPPPGARAPARRALRIIVFTLDIELSVLP